jgi:hypothetical protein
MRFMVMHKVDAAMEAGERPSEGLIQNMGQLIGRSLKAGIFVDGAGLHRSAQRARVSLDGGKRTVERGPFAGRNELVAGFAHVIAASIDHAIDLATTLAEAAGDREIEIGPVVEPWDLTQKPRPEGAPHRFLLLRKGDAAFEAGAQPPAAMRELLDAWKREGILQSELTLKPSATSKRTRPRAGTKRTWTDGPFTESKELIAGFSLLEVPSMEDALRFSDEYGEILCECEIDIRPVA